ncbi:hypothetical protein [Curtobacterium sp. VKM Ac-2887]|uniref:hypothetical protein n=1 Tax=Curtobacterium sp. VKM Ac-2887 TaxID=2783819 RepID=UPI00188BD596|nr:hypothetical protein [Curtobacterium sp. VKM Ac-2887]MBF4588268.1 hypothetical protein [Curtobacterium sp. VKM Ac-2887]
MRDGYVLPYDVSRLAEYLGAFYQFVHSATQAGILRRASADLAEVVRQRRRTYPLAADPDPRRDPQVLEVVGEVASAAFGALANVEAVARALDRHWRTARTVASHNPVVYKAHPIGDHAVNGTLSDARI